jgi:uncharacterized protein YciI
VNDRPPHHILFYEYVGDILDRRGPHRDAHLERIAAGHRDGTIPMAGALGDPPHGAAIVFAGLTPEQIEAFAGEDPYVKAGLVSARRIERWNLV